MTIKRIVLAVTLIVLFSVIVISLNLNAQLDVVGAVLIGSYFASRVVEDNLRNVVVRLESIGEGAARGSSELERHLALIELQTGAIAKHLALLKEAVDRVAYPGPPSTD